VLAILLYPTNGHRPTCLLRTAKLAGGPGCDEHSGQPLVLLSIQGYQGSAETEGNRCTNRVTASPLNRTTVRRFDFGPVGFLALPPGSSLVDAGSSTGVQTHSTGNPLGLDRGCHRTVVA
jgi:hypothetical protein